ncbi:MAG: hypothetical protein K2J17_07640, partial [Paramuribaculum sp.]|nr:hypothetical protein [Paramuribaculum sp.]
RQSAAAKLRHTLARAPRLIFPSALLAQQCTSDAVAQYHATLLSASECRILDMTGGLGIDAFHIATEGRTIDICEINPTACKALAHNAGILGIDGIRVLEGDSSERLRDIAADCYDTIFIDPARRDATQGRRLRSIAECSPDVSTLWPEMLRVARRVLVKVSPMLDISALQASLPCLQSITAVGHRRSTSELLLELAREIDESRRAVKAVSLDPDGKIISEVTFDWIPRRTPADFTAPKEGMTWLEPYAPIMKTGRFNELSRMTGVAQLSRHAHVYISADADPAKDFPGMRYSIERILKADKRAMRSLKEQYAAEGADVAVRDYPLSADELRKALGIARGGNTRIVGCKDAGGMKLFAVLRPVITSETDAP